MNERISLSECTQFVKLAEKTFPNARLMSFGTGCDNGFWYYVLCLKVGKEEIYYKIPCYKEEVK